MLRTVQTGFEPPRTPSVISTDVPQNGRNVRPPMASPGSMYFVRPVAVALMCQANLLHYINASSKCPAAKELGMEVLAG